MSDMTLNYILALDAILILCTVLGTVLLILEKGLYLNRTSERVAEIRRQKRLDEYGKQYSRDELLRRRANNPQ